MVILLKIEFTYPISPTATYHSHQSHVSLIRWLPIPPNTEILYTYAYSAASYDGKKIVRPISYVIIIILVYRVISSHRQRLTATAVPRLGGPVSGHYFRIDKRDVLIRTYAYTVYTMCIIIYLKKKIIYNIYSYI